MYIRTDFHIYKIKSEEIIQGEKYYNIEIRGGLNKLKAEFGKQSENLEELCDCIIETKGHTGDYFHYTYTAFDEPSKKRLLDDMINQDFEIYYAIWTDKGLIYVAKMNSEGKLVLI